jgi:hypothetical protein
MYLPTTLISADTRQILIVVSQAGFPVLFYLFQKLFATLLLGARSDRGHVYAVYNFLIVFCIGIQAYTYYYIFTAGSCPVARAKAMFVPRANPQELGERTFWFIQYDMVVGCTAALLWTVANVLDVVEKKSLGKVVGVSLAAVGAALVIGPGAVVAAGFRWREKRLRRGAVVVEKR